MSRNRMGMSHHITAVLLSPIRGFMALTGHRQDRTMTPVQPSEFAERARARAYLQQMARDQEAHHVVKSAEDYLRQVNDQIAGVSPRLEGRTGR